MDLVMEPLNPVLEAPSTDQKVKPSIPVSGTEAICEEIGPVASISEPVPFEAEISILEVPTAKPGPIVDEPPLQKSIAPQPIVEEPPPQESVVPEIELEDPPSQKSVASEPEVIPLDAFLEVTTRVARGLHYGFPNRLSQFSSFPRLMQGNFLTIVVFHILS